MHVGMCAHVSLWACVRAGTQAHLGTRCGFAPKCDGRIMGPPQSSERGQCPAVSLPPAPPPSSLLPTLLRAPKLSSSPAVSLRVLSGGGKQSGGWVCISCCSFVFSKRGGRSTDGVSAAPGEMQGGEKAFWGCSYFTVCFSGYTLELSLWTHTGVRFQREASTCGPMPSVTITGAALG